MTPTQKAAMEQALEALEYIDSNYMSLPKLGNEASTALRELLEQPEQADEPVAYRSRLESGSYAYCNTPQFFDNAEALYTRPQPAAAIPEGWKLVPSVPTNEWINNLAKQQTGGLEEVPFMEIHQCIAELLAAAPQQKGGAA